MLQKINIAPGINKQVTATGGEGQSIVDMVEVDPDGAIAALEEAEK